MFSVISSRMEAFEKGVDAWKADHLAAIECMDFESLIQGAISLREGIEQLHERIDKVTDGDLVNAGAMRQKIWDLLHKWLAKCEEVDRDAVGFEVLNFEVAGIVEFRRLWRDTANAMQQWRRPTGPHKPLTMQSIRIQKPENMPEDWD